jgi:hypothetical protein
MLTMQVRFSDEQVDKLISRRIDAERAGHTAFPDNIDLSFINHHNANAARSLNVPASAIARDAKGSYVWVVVEDYAVPVQVEVVSAGEQISSVVEKPGARGLPVRADQWRAMTALGRSRVFDVGYRPEAANGNRLLTVNSPVILQPATSLAPGARVRINDAKKS